MPNRSKEGSSRKWKLQAAILQDSTGEIRTTFWNFDRDLRDLEGNDVSITSGDEKGITTIDYENKKSGVVERQLSVEKEATIDEVVGASDQHESGPRPTKGNGPVDKPEPTRVRVYESEDTKRESIERQVALAQAVIYGNDIDGITPDMIVGTAEVFYQWLSNKNIPTPATVTVPATPEEAPDGVTEVL